MKTLLLLLLVPLGNFLFAQQELQNTYIRQSSVYGGMEDSGVSTTTAYTFVAKEKITLINIETDNGQFILEKGDSIIVNLSTYQPYRSDVYVDKKEELMPVYQSKFKITEYNNVKYINISQQIELPLVVTYLYNNKEYISLFKEKIDEVNNAYAP